jgi:hypothetical protein
MGPDSAPETRFERKIGLVLTNDLLTWNGVVTDGRRTVRGQ